MRAISWRLVTPTDIALLSVDELKEHLRVDHSDEDMLIEGYGKAAMNQIEEFTSRALLTQTWDVWFADWPEDGALELPRPQLQSVTSVKYTPAGGVQQTLSPSVYRVESEREPGRVRPAFGQEWPGETLDTGLPLVVRMVCGWPDAESVPAGVVQALRWLVGHMYEHREGVSLANVPPAVMPMAVQWSLQPYRFWYGYGW